MSALLTLALIITVVVLVLQKSEDRKEKTQLRRERDDKAREAAAAKDECMDALLSERDALIREIGLRDQVTTLEIEKMAVQEIERTGKLCPERHRQAWRANRLSRS